jgi:tRNA threonylcarbamoyladenosine modification (KEOPS) complex  Pcc1 subunit
MKKKSNYIFTFESNQKAKLIATAISPEVKHKIPKSNIIFKVDKNQLLLSIESNDISALRAASNSFLRWINTAINVNHIV